MADDLAQLLFATGLSRKTSAVSKQNLLLSLGIVAVLIPATVLGLGIGPTVAIHEQDFFREVEGRRAHDASFASSSSSCFALSPSAPVDPVSAISTSRPTCLSFAQSSARARFSYFPG